MKQLRIALALSALVMVSACTSEKVEVLKSPCVGLEGSPCGPKRVPTGNQAEVTPHASWQA